MKIHCIRCNELFNNIKDFKIHLINKNECIVKCIYIPKKKYIENFKQLNKKFENSFKLLIDDVVKYGCEYCGSLFKDENYYFKHKRKYCKTKKRLDLLSVNIENDFLINKIVIKNYNDNYKNDEKILSNISNCIKKNILKNPVIAIQYLYKLIHLDNPEYRNIYIRNVKDGVGYIYNDGKWTPKIMKELLTDIIEINADRLIDIASDKTLRIKSVYSNEINKMIDEIIENNKQTDELRKTLKSMTYQYRSLIVSTYEKTTNKKFKLNRKIR